MILVRQKTLLFVIIISLMTSLASGIWAYRIGLAASQKADAESVLFYAIAAGILEVLLGFFLFSQGRKGRRELDALTDLARYGGIIPIERLTRLGPLGDRIRDILKELSDASERKSTRIASLTGLLRAALELVDRPIIVSTLDGRIVDASKGARQDPRLAELEPGTSRLEDLFVDINPRAILQEADRTHSVVESAKGLRFNPVYSVRGEISHFIVDLAPSGVMDFFAHLKKGASEARPSTGDAPQKEVGGIFKYLRGRIGKKT
ncbi:hypothetical protein MASR2M78_14980 [Treponema sp.]